jgi:Arc/MetJ family transcription regulator
MEDPLLHTRIQVASQSAALRGREKAFKPVERHRLQSDEYVAIDEQLLEQTRRLGGFRTKRETVNQALREFIRRRARHALRNAVGKIEYDSLYDYKRERRSR